jgi:hypothetical protein
MKQHCCTWGLHGWQLLMLGSFVRACSCICIAFEAALLHLGLHGWQLLMLGSFAVLQVHSPTRALRVQQYSVAK